MLKVLQPRNILKYNSKVLSSIKFSAISQDRSKNIELIRDLLVAGLVDRAIESAEQIIVESDRLSASRLIIDSFSYNVSCEKVSRYLHNDYCIPSPDALERLLVTSIGLGNDCAINTTLIASKLVTHYPNIALLTFNFKNVIIATSMEKNWDILYKFLKIQNLPKFMKELEEYGNNTCITVNDSIVETLMHVKDYDGLYTFLLHLLERSKNNSYFNLNNHQFLKCIQYFQSNSLEHYINKIKDLISVDAISLASNHPSELKYSSHLYLLLTICNNISDKCLLESSIQTYWTDIFPLRPKESLRHDADNMISALLCGEVDWKAELGLSFHMGLRKHRVYIHTWSLMKMIKYCEILRNKRELFYILRYFESSYAKPGWRMAQKPEAIQSFYASILQAFRTFEMNLAETEPLRNRMEKVGVLHSTAFLDHII